MSGSARWQLVGLALAAAFAACGGRPALDGGTGEAGTGGGAGAGTPAAAGTGYAGTGAAGTYGTGAAGTSTTGAGGTFVTGAGGTFVGAFDAGSFDGGVADRLPPGQDAGSPGDAACGALITTPPTGTFVSLSAGNALTCALRADGTAACWGLREFSPLPVLPGQYKHLSVHGSACGVRLTGEIECSGGVILRTTFPLAGEGPFEQVVVGEGIVCGRRSDQVVICEGYAPLGKFETLTGGAYYACGLDSSLQRIVCWAPQGGQDSLMVLDGPFKEVDTGRFFACGLRHDGSVRCWDPSRMQGMSDYAPGTGYHGLSVGETHACALRADGQATCWGDPLTGVLPEAGTVFKAIAPGTNHTCGLLLDGTIKCWGRPPSCTP
jgi:hypothetical protein